MNPKDYLTPEEQSSDIKIAGRLQDINIETGALAARNDNWTDLERANFEALMVEYDDLEKQQEKLHIAGRARYVAEGAAKGAVVYRGDSGEDMDSDPFGETSSIENRTFNDPWNLAEMRAYSGNPEGRQAELRARALSAIEKMQGTTSARRQAMTDMIELHPQLAEQAIVTSDPNYLRYWAKKMRFGDNYTGTPEEMHVVQRAMSLTDAEGGFLIPFQLDPSVILTADGSFNQMRQIARTVVATGDVWNGVTSGNVVWSWDAEATEVSDDATTFTQPTIPINKPQGFVPISIEALQDEANVTSVIGEVLAEGKDDLESVAFATGSGASNQPTGIVTALTGGASEVPSGTTDDIVIADVYGLHDALPAKHRARASWLANNSIYSEIRQFDTAGGAGLWERIGAGRPAELVGRPVYEAEAMDGALTALAENYILIIGNFNHYVIADRVGMTVETIPHLFGATNRFPTGQRGFYAYYRVGADSVHDGAFRMLNAT